MSRKPVPKNPAEREAPLPNHLAARIGALAQVDAKTVVRCFRSGSESCRPSSVERIKRAVALLQDAGETIPVLK